jgi:ankyrin repeat protein
MEGTMSRNIGLSKVLAGCALAASILAGCGTMQPGSGPLALDTVRMVNAIVMDDASYVRQAVESKVVGVNQLVPAPAYMEGTPLITVAARAGSLEVLRYLISAGADVNARTPAGETPMMLAAYFSDDGAPSSQRHELAVRMLVAAGASVENETHNYSPLAYAAYQGRQQTVRFLLERGARVDTEVEEGVAYVNTPLMMAVMMGHMDTALLLLDAGADARIRIKDGPTARDLATKYRHERLAQLLACAEKLAPGEKFTGKCQ